MNILDILDTLTDIDYFLDYFRREKRELCLSYIPSKKTQEKRKMKQLEIDEDERDEKDYYTFSSSIEKKWKIRYATQHINSGEELFSWKIRKTWIEEIYTPSLLWKPLWWNAWISGDNSHSIITKKHINSWEKIRLCRYKQGTSFPLWYAKNWLIYWLYLFFVILVMLWITGVIISFFVR